MDNCPQPCSLYNCKRTYTNAEALRNHIRDHHSNPAQSVPGKSFLCSTIGCDGSFSSMQQLMDHMRRHHKPNYFFLCESCRAKLRSYRTLLKHLQTCAKVAKGKAPKPDAGHPGTETDPSGDTPQEASDSSAPLISALRVPSEVVQPRNPQDAPYGSFPPSLSPAPEPEPQRSLRFGPAGPASYLPHTPPGSNAVWRKNQGQSFSSRILWEHTRGRYSCLQCGHSTPDRQEMTAHIEGQHRSPGARTSHDADAAVASPPSLINSTMEAQNLKYLAL
ncbi:zinc finger protein 414 [Trichomycterus rosablanca]|uniref:zinc finger protein 414 n=1 Tax=Trichomycterus rosablanca TaxID=2290929 RepID=UPI002F3523E7